MRDNRERLLDIVEAIERIEKYASMGEDAFDRDELIQTWIVHHIQIIGEAARGLSSEFREEHSEIAWSQIVAMRNILVHAYFGIDLALVWSAVQSDLPSLKRQIVQLIGNA